MLLIILKEYDVLSFVTKFGRLIPREMIQRIRFLGEFVASVPEYRRTGKGNFKHKLEEFLKLILFCPPI